MIGRLLAGTALLVGGMMFVEDGVGIILDVLGELFADSVISSVNEGTKDAA